MKKIVLFFGVFFAINSALSSEIVDSMKVNQQENMELVASNYLENSEIVKQNSLYYWKVSTKASEYYRSFISEKWGKENIKLSSVSTFVQYSDEMDKRESIDFENGKIKLEFISDEKDSAVPKYFNDVINNLSNESVSEAMEKDPVALLETEFMAKKKITPRYEKKDDTKFLHGYIENIDITKQDIKTKKVLLEDGRKKYIHYVELEMVPDYLQKRALEFKPYILEKAREFRVTPSEIFATIQTESYFNPMAKSHIPAYGLMQIVPSTAGVDAYYALYKKKSLVSPNYLYDSKNNIELGVKYMQIIRYEYLEGIENPISKFYCASTAYNAGIGSVVKSFTRGNYNRAEAIRIVNLMTPDEVYRHLRTSRRLTLEARNYVKHIRDRRKNYLIWDNEV